MNYCTVRHPYLKNGYKVEKSVELCIMTYWGAEAVEVGAGDPEHVVSKALRVRLTVDKGGRMGFLAEFWVEAPSSRTKPNSRDPQPWSRGAEVAVLPKSRAKLETLEINQTTARSCSRRFGTFWFNRFQRSHWRICIKWWKGILAAQEHFFVVLTL